MRSQAESRPIHTSTSSARDNPSYSPYYHISTKPCLLDAWAGRRTPNRSPLVVLQISNGTARQSHVAISSRIGFAIFASFLARSLIRRRHFK
eukprot:scaffold39033_cov30-Prasinocladus_malaysianus.AAC.2